MGREQWGDGITGTTIKDTRTISRGRVEVGEGDRTGWGGWRDGEKKHTIVTDKNKLIN